MYTVISYILSVLPSKVGKTDVTLIPCPFKYYTQLDCPGCGFQRSFLALMEGNIQDSLILYPPTIPFVLSLLGGLCSYAFKWDRNSKLLKVLYITTGLVMMGNYLYKVFSHQLH